MSYKIFLSVLIFSPVAFGAVEQWSLAAMESLCIAAISLFFAKKLKDKEPFIYEVPGFIPLILFLIYILIQLIPLPLEIIQFLSPETYTLYKETIGIYEPLTWVSLSINQKATLMEFFRITAYISIYVLTVQLLTKRDLLKKTVKWIIVLASFLSFSAILQYIIISNNKILWFREVPPAGKPFGQYVNRNHYAGFIEMIFPILLSLFIYYKPLVRYASFRKKIVDIFNQKNTNKYILIGFSAILAATSVFLSLSRGGIVSLSLSMVFLGGILLRKGTDKKRGFLAIFTLIVFSVGWFGWEPIFERFEKIRNAHGNIVERIGLWKESMNIIRDFPITGTGFGSFVNIYPKYGTLSEYATVDHAHNDYIELLADGGIIAALLIAWFLIVLFYKTYKTFLKRRERYSVYLYTGSMTGIVSILIHSITDFNLHIGANGLYFFFLAGLSVSAANTRLRSGEGDTYLKPIKFSSLRLIAIPVVIILFISLVFNIGVIIGSFYFLLIKDIKLNNNENIGRKRLLAIHTVASRASLADPLEPAYHYTIANIEILLKNMADALHHYKRSVRLSPVNSEYIQNLGLVMSGLERHDIADKLFQSSIKYNANNPARYKRYASWLLSHSEKKKGIENMKIAISLTQERTREYITLMLLHRLNDEEIHSALPEKVEPHLLFADYLSDAGIEKRAEKEYIHALKYVKNEERISPSYFYKGYKFFMKKGLYNAALEVMQNALKYLPDNARIQLITAALYKKLKIADKESKK